MLDKPFCRSAARLLGSVAFILTLSACVNFSPDGGFGSVERTARERLGQELHWARSDEDRAIIAGRVAELLALPLTVDGAVQIALLNNRGLQASFHELGLSEASLVQAGRLPNPHFAMLRASALEGGTRSYTIEQALTINVFALITMPQALTIERRRFEQTQRMVALDVLRIASEARKAYYTAVAAEESARYMRKVGELAEIAADLARRMREVGNWNRLQQAREQSFAADAAINLARTERARVGARERLTRLLGLWGMQTDFVLPERLPSLPAAPTERPDVERMAIAQRIDLQAIRLETEALAANLGLTKTTRFINVLELGPARVLEGARSEPYQYGYEISFEIPLFDFGTAKVARAEAIYLQALDRAAEAAINARSEVREAYLGYRTGYDIARQYRDEIVPLRKQMADENLLRYNGMLISVFELLADARAQIASVNSSIEALRDFWIAEADLEMAMIGKPALTTASRSMSATAEVGAAH